MIDINYYRTISNSLDCTQQDADIYEAQNALLYDFDSNPSCKTVLLNSEPVNVLAWIDTDIVTGGKSYKIRCKPNQILKIGDILNIDDEIWFVTKVDIDKLVSYAGTLAKATCILKFYKNGVYRELPCYITVGTRNYISERDNDFIRLPKSLYTGYCPDVDYLDKQDCNMRFYIRDYVYRAVGIDNLTVLDNEVRDGLIILKFQDDSVCDDDNMELGIANYWSNQPQEEQGNIIGTTAYNVATDINRDYLVCGERITITSIVTNGSGDRISTNRVFSITDENDNNIQYVTVVNTTNDTITLQVSKDGKYINKRVKLKIEFAQLSNTIFEQVFTISSLV